LRKRENFRKAFDDFNYRKIATYDEKKYEDLLLDQGIIRNKLKIRAAITNANSFMTIQQEYGTFSNFLWNYTDQKPVINHWKNLKEIPATTPLSDTISKDLKARGFKFVGSTVIYAFMQAIGMVNDHVTTCFRHEEIGG